jgi:hypothetical protein
MQNAITNELMFEILLIINITYAKKIESIIVKDYKNIINNGRLAYY